MRDFFEDRIDDIVYYFQEYKMIVTIIGVVLIFVVGGFLVSSNNKSSPEELTTEFNLIKQKQENAMYYFSLLDIGDMGEEGESIISADVYLKRPLQTEENLNQAYNDLIEVIKYKYDTNDNILKGARIQVYDRMLQYEEDIEPVGVVMYVPNSEKAVEIVHGKDANLEGLNVNYLDVMWQSVQEIKAKDINYEEDYIVNIAYDYNDDVEKPLTDEEFQFYLKLNRYMVMSGGWEEGISKYLEWELGVVEDLVSTDNVIRGYLEFIGRVKDSGIKEDYYDGYDWALKSEMLVKNPKWVYYVETGEYTENDVEALKGVVLHEPEYLEILVENTMSQEELGEAKDGLTDSLEKVIEGSDSEDENLNNTLQELQENIEKGDKAFEESEDIELDEDAENDTNTKTKTKDKK